MHYRDPQPKALIRIRLQTKFMASIVGLLCLLMGAIMVFVGHEMRVSILDEFQKRGLSVAKNLSAVNANFIATYNYVSIQQSVKQVTDEGDLLYAAVVFFDGEVAAYSGPEGIKAEVLSGSIHEQALAATDTLIQSGELGGIKFCDFAVPVFLKGERWGTVRAGLSLEAMHLAIRRTHEILLGMGVFGVLCGYLASLLLARRITRPIGALVNSMKAISNGDYQHPIELTTRDEIGYFAKRFATMQEIIRDQIRLLTEANEELTETNRKLRQEVIDRERVEQDLRKAKNVAEAASLAKSQFLANMSHEIRTPMNGVLGMMELLINTKLDPKQRRFAETVQQSGMALLSIINDILDLSKIEANRMMLETIDFDLRQCVEEGMEFLAERAFSNQLELLCRFPADLPTALRGDPGRLRQVLTNLISNAIKFTKVGEIVVTASLAEDSQESVLVRFEVSDTGIGVPEDAHERIFDSFAQGDGSTTRKYGGTGLGLTISKQLAERMGGTIGVKKRDGGGSIFWFTARLEKQPRTTEQALPCTQELAGMHVLIVDDNKMSGAILAEQLDYWKVVHRTAKEGKGALQMLMEAVRHGEPFDAMILNMSLRDMAAVECIRAVHEHPGLAGLATVMLACGEQCIDMPDELPGTISCCIAKPVRHWDLYNSLLTLRSVTLKDQQLPEIQESGFPVTETPDESGLARVLVAEDNEINQEVARAMLESLGCRVNLACNGLEVLRELTRRTYDLILMDCQMPEMDGYETTRRVRAGHSSYGEANIPIVALTANDVAEDRAKCLMAGMDDYLAKPFTQHELAMILERWLTKKPVQKTEDFGVTRTMADIHPTDEGQLSQ